VLLAVWISKRPNPEQTDQPPVPPIVEKPKSLPKNHTYEEALSSISYSELKKQLEYICSDDLEGRMSGKKGNVEAAKYIKQTYESYGLNTEYQKFDITRMNPGPKGELGDEYTQNIIAWQEGIGAYKDEIVVVGAHMDHIGYGPRMSQWGGGKIHPGADDNGSGTVALLQIAKACSYLKGQNKRTLVFISFSGEEMGLIGSKYYCNNPLFPKNNPAISKHVFMLNMDMVGRLNTRNNLVSFEERDDVDKVVDFLSEKYTFAKRITGRGAGGSDHASFYNKKVPVICLHTGQHNDYHTPTDNLAKIDYNGIEQVAKYAFEICWNITQAGTNPRSNWGDFKPFNPDRDHGRQKFPE
jgi:hypothetical protein